MPAEKHSSNYSSPTEVESRPPDEAKVEGSKGRAAGITGAKYRTTHPRSHCCRSPITARIRLPSIPWATGPLEWAGRGSFASGPYFPEGTAGPCGSGASGFLRLGRRLSSRRPGRDPCGVSAPSCVRAIVACEGEREALPVRSAGAPWPTRYRGQYAASLMLRVAPVSLCLVLGATGAALPVAGTHSLAGCPPGSLSAPRGHTSPWAVQNITVFFIEASRSISFFCFYRARLIRTHPSPGEESGGGLISLCYSESHVPVYAGFSISKLNVISFKEQGKEAWVVESDVTQSLHPDWVSQWEKMEKFINKDPEDPSFQDDWKCKGTFKRQQRNRKEIPVKSYSPVKKYPLGDSKHPITCFRKFYLEGTWTTPGNQRM
nr:uncharacterized protein LOC106847383 [Equus asinus]